MSNEDLQQIQALVAGAKSVLVLTHASPSVDTMGSALAISLAFQKMGKMVTVAMESPATVEIANLVGIDKVQTALGGKNLMLTYKPYNEGDFQRVLYPGTEGNDAASGEFKLVIVPRDGFVPSPANFSFSSVGGSADLIVTVEVLEPPQLGRLYDPNLFSGATPVINIDNHDPNKDYGKFNLVEPDAASVSEITAFFLRAVNAQLDADMAGNLYQGISAATNNFSSPKVGAATFEAAAICIRAGAKKAGMGTAPATPVTPPPVSPTLNNVPEDWTQPKIYRGGGNV